MITDKELIEIGARNSSATQFGREFSEESFIRAARAIYQLGRQHQRESDAAFLDSIESGVTRGDIIRSNTGELN